MFTSIVSTLTTLTSQVTPPNLDQPGAIEQVLQMLAKAYSDHAWTLLVGIILMVVTWVAKKFNVVDRLPKAAIPYGVMAIAMLSSIALGLEQGQSVVSVIITGLTVGLAAIGSWEVAGQHVANAITPAAKPDAPAVPKAPKL